LELADANEKEFIHNMKTAIQLDFDGTVTEEDVSFLLLDTYVGSIWREHLKEYMEGRIPVGTFNKKVFSMVKADKKTMTDLVLSSDRVKIRPGFREFLDYCNQEDIKTVIVSNGLIFYIEAILNKLGLNSVEVYAAQNRFSREGMKVAYVGPDGTDMEIGFKESYTELLEKQGYGVIYVGNGASDIFSARRARHVFAVDELLKCCRQENVMCTPFNDFFDVIKGLKTP
jgi:2-hydroxy-3-keto-5-methylthiopentenyl-1-phosphate phosphatase